MNLTYTTVADVTDMAFLPLPERPVIDLRLNGEDITLEIDFGDTPRKLRDTIGRCTGMVVDHFRSATFESRVVSLTMEDDRPLYLIVRGDGKCIVWTPAERPEHYGA